MCSVCSYNLAAARTSMHCILTKRIGQNSRIFYTLAAPSYPEAVRAQGDGGAAPEAQRAQEARHHPGHGRRVRHHSGRDLEQVHYPLLTSPILVTHIGLAVGAWCGHGVWPEHGLLLNDHHSPAPRLTIARDWDLVTHVVQAPGLGLVSSPSLIMKLPVLLK